MWRVSAQCQPESRLCSWQQGQDLDARGSGRAEKYLLRIPFDLSRLPKRKRVDRYCLVLGKGYFENIMTRQ